MKNRNIFRNSNGFSIFGFTCIWDLNVLKIPTLVRHVTLSAAMDRYKRNIWALQ